MLESFNNETENGKLYISYPMVEALRDFEAGVCGKGQECYVPIEKLSDYKHISSMCSFIHILKIMILKYGKILLTCLQ